MAFPLVRYTRIQRYHHAIHAAVCACMEQAAEVTQLTDLNLGCSKPISITWTRSLPLFNLERRKYKHRLPFRN